MKPASLPWAVPLGLVALLATADPSSGASAMPPSGMVRSLQALQDRIADGDAAALPMQRKLLEMIDKRLRAAGPAVFADPQAMRALQVYAMSGGNPATLDLILSRGGIDAGDQPVGQGIAAYVHGRTGSALAAFSAVDPMALHPDLGASVALIKGSLVAKGDASGALKLFDQARLLAPGSLIEEAALRRSLPLAASEGDRRRFLHASDSYVRRFRASPYATQFADAFVTGVVTLQPAISPAEVDAVVSALDGAQRRAIYLRLSRRAAVEGLTGLSAAAAAKAIAEGSGAADRSDVRADLYSGLGSIASGGIAEVAARLGRIDRAKLSLSDRLLLDAARKIAGEVLASPLPEKPAPGIDPTTRVAVAHEADAVAETPDGTDLMLDAARTALGSVDDLLDRQAE